MENIMFLSKFEQTRKTVVSSSIRNSNLIPMYIDEMIFTQNQKRNLIQSNRQGISQIKYIHMNHNKQILTGDLPHRTDDTVCLLETIFTALIPDWRLQPSSVHPDSWESISPLSRVSLFPYFIYFCAAKMGCYCWVQSENGGTWTNTNQNRFGVWWRWGFTVGGLRGSDG